LEGFERDSIEFIRTAVGMSLIFSSNSFLRVCPKLYAYSDSKEKFKGVLLLHG